MVKPEIVQMNETHKILRDFQIQKNHLISIRTPDIINKKNRTCYLVNFDVPLWTLTEN